MAEIQFELRKRSRKTPEFWTITYDVTTGDIESILPGNIIKSNTVVVSFPKVKRILSGEWNQNDFKVAFNENLGAIDLVNIRKPLEFKKKKTWQGWLSAAEYQGDPISDIRIILFNDTGILRIESTRVWATRLKEKSELTESSTPLYITDQSDPHQLFGTVNVNIEEIIERGFWETRLWAFMDHDIVQQVLYQGQQIRMNISPIATNLFFTRVSTYSAYSGVADNQTVLSHPGQGKHVSVFLKDGGLWAQSYYELGSPIDQLVGNLSVAIVLENDPDNFVTWAELPALMLRQHHPFELLPKWQYQSRPNVLYKANNIDIGVMS